MTGATAVLDIGKTNAKVSLWDAQGRALGRWSRANEPQVVPGYRALDVRGIEAWLLRTLAGCAREAPVRWIVPVGHGAAAALVRDGRLFADPVDYEEPASDAERSGYASQRDPFAATGSPLLPGALNLGMQLHLIESRLGPLPAGVTILPWPQYWAWRLCGVMASEVTSLGCHSDLWRPMEGRFTDLAIRRGWDARMAPLRHAGDTLSAITSEVAASTGLPAACEVLCGLHDSNAALLASRGHAPVAQHDATVLSTGTWFVAMRSLPSAAVFDGAGLPEHRDCLINADIHGRAVPSARFMGGREAEIICGVDAHAAADAEPAEARLQRLHALLAGGARVYPSFVAGVGPFPDAAGTVTNLGDDPRDRRIAADLYLAMMADTSLTLIGSTGRLLVEGRFADGESVFLRALAAVRPHQQVYTCPAGVDLAYGALRLVAPDLPPPAAPCAVEPLALDLEPFAGDWRRHAGVRS